MLMTSIKAGIRQVIRSTGFTIARVNADPSITLLGLASFPIRTIIDVGANTGQFAKKISVFFPDAKLYCFEPLAEPFKELSDWASTRTSKVFPINLALGEYDGVMEMFLHENHTPSSSFLATTTLTEKYYPFTKRQKKVSIKVKTLDAVMLEAAANLEGGLLIKLDVQGYEDRVIKGGKNTFAKASACILEISLDTLYEGQARFLPLLTLLADVGYTYAGNLSQVYALDGHCIYMDAVFVKSK